MTSSSVKVPIYVKTKISATPPPRGGGHCHSARPFKHLFIPVQHKPIWEAPSSLPATNPTVDAIQNIIKQTRAHIKIAAKFYFPERSTVPEQNLGSTMMKCRLHWYITLARVRRRTALTLPRFINRMWCIRENLVWFLHVYTKERFYQPPFLTYRRISTLHHYTLLATKRSI